MRVRDNLLFVFIAAAVIAVLGTAWQQRRIRCRLESSMEVSLRGGDDELHHLVGMRDGDSLSPSCSKTSVRQPPRRRARH